MEVDTGPKSVLHSSKVKKHGVTVVLDAEEVKTSFSADFTFSTAAGATNKLNIGNLHRLLFKHMLDAADDQSIRLLPTQENPKTPQKSIGDLTLFPRVEKEHRDFFHRSTFHLHERNQVKIRIKHTIISKTPLSKIRNKIMPWLRANDIYLCSSAFDLEDTVCIAWIMGAHPKLTFRPSIDNDINDGILEIKLNDEQEQELARLTDGKEKLMPKVFVAPRTQNYGNGSARVSSNTLGICCLKRHAKLLKELAAQVDLGNRYRIIPQGLRQMSSETVYRKYLLANNDLQNNLRSIAVIGLIPQALDWEFYVHDEDKSYRMEDLFTERFLFYSIEKTHNTDITGRFLCVVSNDNYEVARDALTKFLETNFLQHDKAEGYESYFDTPGPKLASAPPTGGVIQHCVDRLIAEIDAVEADGVKLRDKPSVAWQGAATHFHFDLDDETFPAMPESKQPSQPTAIPDTQSAAPTARSSTSKGGTSTGMSTDMSTIVSEMQTMISQQSKMMEMFMQQQTETMKQQQAVTTQQISSLISLVSQMIPQQHQQPPMYYPSPPPRHPPTGMPNGMIFSQPPHMAPSNSGYIPMEHQPTSPPISTFQKAGKVMDVETPESIRTPVNTITPSAPSTAVNDLIHRKTTEDSRFTLPNPPKRPNPNSPRGPKRSEHPSATPPRPNPARTSFSTPERPMPPPDTLPLPPSTLDPGLAKKCS
jgi:hypothetical protein